MSQACRELSTLNELSSWLKTFIRFKEARLQAESSTNMYSLHGFDALMRFVFLTGFHRLIVVSYCMTGSPQTHAASAIFAIRSRARCVLEGCPVKPSFVCQVESFST